MPCQAEGRVTPATVVDHAVAWQTGRTQEERHHLRTNPENFVSMCAEHHSRKTVRQDGGFGFRRAALPPRQD